MWVLDINFHDDMSLPIAPGVYRIKKDSEVVCIPGSKKLNTIGSS